MARIFKAWFECHNALHKNVYGCLPSHWMIVAAIAFGLFCACESSKPEQTYREASAYAQNGRYDEAIALFQNLIKEFPENEYALLALHRIELAKRDREAQKMFSLAKQYEEKGNFDQAYSQYAELIKHFKVGSLVREAVGKIKAMEAKTTAGKAFKRAEEAFLQRKLENAKQQFQNIVNRFSDTPLALKAQERVGSCESVLLADKYYRYELYDGAQKNYKKILANYPEIPFATSLNDRIADCTKKIDAEENIIRQGNLKPLYITGSTGANLRGVPTTDEYEPLGRLPRGTVVLKIKKSGDWYKVRHPKGMRGWVHGDLASENPAFFSDEEVKRAIALVMAELGTDLDEIDRIDITWYGNKRTLEIDTQRKSSDTVHLFAYFLSTMPVFLAKQKIEAVVIDTADNMRVAAILDILWKFMLGTVNEDYFLQNGIRIQNYSHRRG